MSIEEGKKDEGEILEGKPKEGKEDEMITVSKSSIDALMKRVTALERGEITTVIEEAERKKIATMRVWDKKLVIGWNQPKKRKNKETNEDELLFQIHLKNKEKIEEVEVNYLKFLNEADKIEVEIVHLKREDEVKIQGMTTVKEVEGYATRDTGIKVPVKITIPHYTAVVKLPSGHELEVDVNFLNA